jgi:hypothetical protein
MSTEQSITAFRWWTLIQIIALQDSWNFCQFCPMYEEKIAENALDIMISFARCLLEELYLAASEHGDR